jgi:hypothetical protein
MKEAARIFSSSASRPRAKKILIMIVDKRSTSDPSLIKEKAKELESSGVLVIPVGVGEVREPEIAICTPYPGLVLPLPTLLPTDETVKKIDDKFKKALKGMFILTETPFVLRRISLQNIQKFLVV